MNAFIPGYNESSPRSQGEKLTDYLSNELRQKNFNPIRIFAMADKNKMKQCKFGEVLDALRKCVPSFTDEIMTQIPLAF